MKYAKIRYKAPVFRTADLDEPDVVHKPRCGAAFRSDGSDPKSEHCRCCAGARSLPQGALVEIVVDGEGGSLVEAPGHAPVWIENTMLSSTHQVPQAEIDPRAQFFETPPDHVAVMELVSSGQIKYRRRRRGPEGGEIVFIRSEFRGGKFEPWRYIACTHGSNPQLILVATSIPAAHALNPGWDEVRYLSVEMSNGVIKPERWVMPVFPLPDGTVDPGWRP